MWRLPLVVMLSLATASPLRAQSFQERVAPCLACHGEKGQSEKPDVPSLGAKPTPYTLIQLYLFREKMLTIEIMNKMTKGFSDDDLRKLSDFIATFAEAAAAGRCRRSRTHAARADLGAAESLQF